MQLWEANLMKRSSKLDTFITAVILTLALGLIASLNHSTQLRFSQEPQVRTTYHPVIYLVSKALLRQ